jgi:hypothetical protein
LEILMDYFFAAIFAVCAALFAALCGLLLGENDFWLAVLCLGLALFAYKSAFDAMKLAIDGHSAARR